MKTFIAFLRGINVSGKNRILMEELRASFNRAGYSSVTTYLQSGNIVFASPDKPVRSLQDEIARFIETDFSLNVPVLVLTLDHLLTIAQQNPFINDPTKDPAFFHVTMLDAEPGTSSSVIIEPTKQPGEEFLLNGSTIYLYCPHGYGTTRLTNTFFEKKFNTTATTRNWKTINEVLQIAIQLKNSLT